VKIYAQGKGPAGALEYNMENWGNGSQVTTSLINPAGEVSYFAELKFSSEIKFGYLVKKYRIHRRQHY
jgi:hypothetical protein